MNHIKFYEAFVHGDEIDSKAKRMEDEELDEKGDFLE